VNADYQKTFRAQGAFETRQYLSLRCVVEVSKNQIPAQYEIKDAGGRFVPHILTHKRHPLPEPWTQAKFTIVFNKGLPSPVFGRRLDTAIRIAGACGTLQQLLITVSGNNLNPGSRSQHLVPHTELPEDSQAVGFLTRTAAGTPDAEHCFSAFVHSVDQFRQNKRLQAREYASVTEKPGDGYATHSVKDFPFLAVALQIRPVIGNICNLQSPQSPANALTQLLADFAKSRPAHVQLRQRPLQKGYAGVVIHPARPNRCPDQAWWNMDQVEDRRVSSRVPLS